jgi:hypothetical protein
MFAEMSASTRGPVGEAEAQAAISRLEEMSADVRGGAILDAAGRALGASGDPARWAGAGAALLAAADATGDEPAGEVHVATGDGEAFAVRHRGLAMVAVAERSTLAALMVFDMRTALGDIGDGPADAGGRSVALGPDADAGSELSRAAARLIEAAG